MALRVLVAEDHAMVRQFLRDFLRREGFEVAGEAANGQEALRLAAELRPDLVVFDLSMPTLNGLEAARQLAAEVPQIRAVALTMHSENQYVIEALRAGFKGYVLKSQVAEDLAKALREVARGGVYLSPQVSHVVVDAYLRGDGLAPDPLTAREREVLQLIAEGKTTRELGEVLGISVKTAEAHRSNIMAKLEVHNTAGLVRYAVRRGLVPP